MRCCASIGRRRSRADRSTSRGEATALARTIAEAAEVSVPDFAMPVRNLSGGNQQRLVARREMRIAKRLLVAAYPSRGLDVGAINSMLRYLVELRDAGVAVVLFSEELEELFSLSDRLIVLYEGRIMGDFPIDDGRPRDGRPADGRTDPPTGSRRGVMTWRLQRFPAATPVVGARRARWRRSFWRSSSAAIDHRHQRCRRSAGPWRAGDPLDLRLGLRTAGSRPARDAADPVRAWPSRSRFGSGSGTSAPRASSTWARLLPPGSASSSPGRRR